MSVNPFVSHPQLQELLALAEAQPLGAATMTEDIRRRLKAGLPLEDSISPQGALAGLWLRLGDWDEAHRVAQDLHTPEGSFWHGILHRVEGDDGNACYWFARVSSHPTFASIGQEAKQLSREYGVNAFPEGDWRPAAFVDFRRRAMRNPSSQEAKLADALERAEWRILFDYCAQPRAANRSVPV